MYLSKELNSFQNLLKPPYLLDSEQVLPLSEWDSPSLPPPAGGCDGLSYPVFLPTSTLCLPTDSL